MFSLDCKPCEYTRISQYFKSKTHKGIDLVNKKLMTKTPIYATADGTVVCAGGKGHNWHWSYGNQVAIYHGGGNYTNNGHLTSIRVRVGQKVKAGQLIGYMGHTGNTVPKGIGGTHLHFEVHRGKKWNRVNPLPYIEKAGKPVTPVTSTYKVGNTYTLQEDMNIRTGHSVSANKTPKAKLSADALKNLTSDGMLKKGTKVTCQDVWTGNSETWLKIPSGWICAENSKGKVYIK